MRHLEFGHQECGGRGKVCDERGGGECGRGGGVWVGVRCVGGSGGVWERWWSVVGEVEECGGRGKMSGGRGGGVWWEG